MCSNHPNASISAQEAAITRLPSDTASLSFSARLECQLPGEERAVTIFVNTDEAQSKK